MKYFKAREIAVRPFILFYQIGESIEDLQSGGFADINGQITDPLVVDENNLPVYTGGICHKDITNGQFVNRDQDEIDDYVSAAIQDQTVADYADLQKKVNLKRFDFDNSTFQISPTLSDRVRAIEKLPAGNLNIQALDSVYQLSDANRDGFTTAYYTALGEVTDPNNV